MQICLGRSTSCFAHGFVFLLINEKMKGFERYFYIKIIDKNMIPTNLVAD